MGKRSSPSVQFCANRLCLFFGKFFRWRRDLRGWEFRDRFSLAGRYLGFCAGSPGFPNSHDHQFTHCHIHTHDDLDFNPRANENGDFYVHPDRDEYSDLYADRHSDADFDGNLDIYTDLFGNPHPHNDRNGHFHSDGDNDLYRFSEQHLDVNCNGNSYFFEHQHRHVHVHADFDWDVYLDFFLDGDLYRYRNAI